MKLPVLFNRNCRTEEYQKAVNIAKKIAKEHPNSLFCPYCGARLVATGQVERLADSYEDAMCAEPSLKLTFKCSNGHCEYHDKIRYILNGDAYVNNYEDSFVNSNYERFGQYSTDALNSIALKCYCEVYAPGKNKEIFLQTPKPNKKVLVITKRYTCDDFGDYQYVSYGLELRHYTEDNTYTSHTIHSIWYQLKNCYRDAKAAYNRWRETDDIVALSEVYGYSNRFRNLTKSQQFFYKYLAPILF